MLSENVIKLIQEARKLRDHCHSMEMATHYKKFNYGYFDRLLGKVIEEDTNNEERKILRPWEKQ